MKPILITLFFLLSACSTQPLVLYSSTWKQDYDEAVMSKCKDEATKITWLMFEADGNTWSMEDVMRVENFVFVSCLKYNNLVI